MQQKQSNKYETTRKNHHRLQIYKYLDGNRTSQKWLSFMEKNLDNVNLINLLINKENSVYSLFFYYDEHIKD